MLKKQLDSYSAWYQDAFKKPLFSDFGDAVTVAVTFAVSLFGVSQLLQMSLVTFAEKAARPILASYRDAFEKPLFSDFGDSGDSCCKPCCI